MGAVVRLIQNPPFELEWSQIEKIPELDARSSLSIIQGLGILFFSIKDSICVTFWYSLHSFVVVFASYLRMPGASIRSPVIAVLFCVWGFGVGTCFLVTLFVFVVTRTSTENRHLLSLFAEEGIDVSHIRTKALKIDVSKVPQKVHLDQLLEMFDQIPERMRPKPALPNSMVPVPTRESLETFIRHVKGRVPFLGTPPAYQRSLLLSFYQQIEDASRFCIHRVNRDFDAFKRRHGEGPYSEEQKREYENLLEDRSRVAIQLAAAGTACGARYMGEAMELYSIYEEKNFEGNSLKETLVELLAAERKKIAEAEIQGMGFDTHTYAEYMAKFGPLLGIPGTENVTEHLSHSLNLEKTLQSFFSKYNAQRILAVLQERAKKSGEFREQLIDWFKAQRPKNWALESKEQQEKLKAELEDVLRWSDVQESGPFYTAYINFLLFDKTGVEKEDLRAVCLRKCSLQEKRGMHSFLSRMGEDVFDLSEEELQRKFLNLQKIEKVCALCAPMSPDTAQGIVEGRVSLQEALENRRELQGENAFVTELFPEVEKIETEGLSPELWEWVLISHRIFLPQQIPQRIEVQDASFAREILQASRRARQGPPIRDSVVRYQAFPTQFEVFNKVFQSDPERWAQSAEERLGQTFYPKWKRVVCIDLPEAVGDFWGSFNVSLVAQFFQDIAETKKAERGKLLRQKTYQLWINSEPLIRVEQPV